MDKRADAIAKASWVGIIGNIFLALSKIFIGWIFGSMALIADGVDSSTDVLSFILTLFTAMMISRPPNVQYSFGYKRVETIATKLLAFLIFFAGYQILSNSISKIYHGESSLDFSFWLLFVPLLSIALKYGMARYQLLMGEKHQSNLLKANAENMKNDVLISSAVLVGLLLGKIFNFPMADSYLALLVSFWILWVAIKIFLEASMIALDNISDLNVYKLIIQAAESVEGVFHPHRIRISRLGNMLLITLDIEVAPELTVEQAHHIGQNVEKSLHQSFDNIYDIVIHFEPYKNKEDDEKFGVSRFEL